jgi:hypothetical protein
VRLYATDCGGKLLIEAAFERPSVCPRLVERSQRGISTRPHGEDGAILDETSLE